MPSTPHPCRLSLVFASQAPIVVILRRGPTRWVEVIRWNTATDSFECGQWLYGRIYGERCGLSPNGELFVYFAMKYGRVDTAAGYKYTFTAVSKPPYLTALAMWPEGSAWGGGGRFIDNHTLRLAYGKHGTSHPGVAPTTIFMAPMPPPHPNHLPVGLRIETDLDYYAPDAGFRISPVSGDVWRGRDHRGREIVARDGALLVLDGGNEVLLRNFNGDQRQSIPPPPAALVWPRAAA